MTHTEALRLALEFIQSISPAFICEASHHKKHEQHASNEPCPHVAKQKQVYEAIKAALEAKDEPVAWMYEVNHAHTCLDLFEPPDDAYDKGTLYPLYLAPQQRKPLTDEEIYLCTNHIDRNARGWANKFARAIEAAHGIKGEA